MRLKHRIWEVNLKGEVKLADSGLRLFFLVAPRKTMISPLYPSRAVETTVDF